MMKYVHLGNKIRVSELCLGSLTFGMPNWGSTKEESRKVFDAFARAGGNFIDTADFYSKGVSEEWIGEFIKDRREKFVIATKFGLCMRPGDSTSWGNNRAHMFEAVEGSLKRLGIDHIDLFWVHAWDHITSAEEIMHGLNDLIQQGIVRYIGISNTPAWFVAECNTLAQQRGWNQFIAIQIQYNLLERTAERELIPMSVVAWSPLANGLLSGKYTGKNASSGRLRPGIGYENTLTERNLNIVRELTRLAAEIPCSPAALALQWVHNKGIIPIIGARTLEQLNQNLDCLNVSIPESVSDQLNTMTAITYGYPHEYFQRKFIREVAFDGKNPTLRD
jgi:aryl-alcohol dehydrogenase-like predicted oxidoreductase